MYTKYKTAPGAHGPAIDRPPLAEQVAAHLRQRIFDRRLSPGTRLDEVELASALGVSRTPVREALRQLTAWGLVELRARRGAYVASTTLEDLAQIFPIMARLEGWVAHEVALRASRAELGQLERLHAQLEHQAARGDSDRYWEINYAFHVALQAMAGNRFLEAILRDLRGRLNLARHRSLKLPGRMRRSLAEHRALLRALRGRHAARAEALMRDHLMNQLAAFHRLEDADE